MAKVQVKSEVLVNRKGCDEVQVLMKINLLPRGSGNRNLARRIGKAFEADERLSPHVRKIRVGSSSVWLYVVPSLELSMTLWQMQHAKAADIAGQLKLPFGAVLVE